MTLKPPRRAFAPLVWLTAGSGAIVALGLFGASAFASSPIVATAGVKAVSTRHAGALDDSVRRTPAADLTLDANGARKADALALFVEGARLEEAGELEAALVAYQKVLTVHPGEVELASRVAALLTRQEDFPRAIDILKDASKANPKETGPYLQLAYLYARFLQKPEQALKYANQA